jgi:malonyl-CoA/methylmalonyl-CoA synthetase
VASGRVQSTTSTIAREQQMTHRSNLPLIGRAMEHGGRTAIVTPGGACSYRQVLDESALFAARLLDGEEDLGEQRVVFLCPPGVDYVRTEWAIWRAGGVAVPLSPLQPAPEWDYVLSDCGATIVVADPTFVPSLAPICASRGARLVAADERDGPRTTALPDIAPSRRAMILYTSGTTSRPKGVVTTHRNIAAQVTTLVSAWEWSAADRILHVLPLNHVHGIINVLSCALWSGATCEMLPRFDADGVWQRFREGGLTLFMAVPTIYAKLIAAWERAPEAEQRAMAAGASRLRLMVSGSAALPVSVLDRWKSITGHVLLERYGMTEIGMALSNPFRGERRPGSVGVPLPGVEVRLVNEEGREVEPGTPGEIEVSGPGVFLEYWNRPDATREAFRVTSGREGPSRRAQVRQTSHSRFAADPPVPQRWFRTGDVAVLEQGMYRILGRSSTDIIKTGGYKVSALEIEEVIRTHPDVRDSAVVGVEDDEWGERVAAAVVMQPGRALDVPAFQAWLRDLIAKYKVPTRLLVVSELPRNAMGKVTKAQVREMFGAQDGGGRTKD